MGGGGGLSFRGVGSEVDADAKNYGMSRSAEEQDVSWNAATREGGRDRGLIFILTARAHGTGPGGLSLTDKPPTLPSLTPLGEV
jgi:hypothetical protein